MELKDRLTSWLDRPLAAVSRRRPSVREANRRRVLLEIKAPRQRLSFSALCCTLGEGAARELLSRQPANRRRDLKLRSLQLIPSPEMVKSARWRAVCDLHPLAFVAMRDLLAGKPAAGLTLVTRITDLEGRMVAEVRTRWWISTRNAAIRSH